MPITASAKNTILNGLTGRANTFGNSVYVGLSSTDPATTVTEPRFGGYARVLIGTYQSSGTHKFGTPENGIVKNDEFIYFPESTGAWGNSSGVADELKYFVLYTAVTGGTLIGYGLLESGGTPTPITVSEEKTVVMFRPNTLVISIPDDV